MHKTIYIEVDEEITSIVDRIKREGAPDIFIVVPKNAMLVQGVINLKLLKKESAKIKKNIILVTNDQQAKKVIGRIGFETKEAPIDSGMEDDYRQGDFEDLGEIDKLSNDSFGEIRNQEENFSRQREIGSSSFFDGDDFSDENEDDFINDELGNSPEKIIRRMDMKKNNDGRKKTELVGGHNIQNRERNIFKKRNKKKEAMDFDDDIDYDDESFKGRSIDKKAESFFGKGGRENFPERLFEKKEKPVKKEKRKTNYFVIFLMVCFFSLIGFGGWAYFNWPQMNIVIYPKEKNFSTTADLNVLTNLTVSDIGKNELVGKIEEVEIAKTLEFEATGEKYSSDKGKARGRITILNKYSSSEQSLIATTRVLSKEGKLFRLTDSVVVPGMDGENPGKVEVGVVADQPGADFNIDSSTFTIEGFKGGPKYEKFEVFSENSMTGGSDSSDNKLVKYILDKDVDNARTKTLEALEKTFKEDLVEKIEDSRGYVLESVKKEIIENKSSLDAGDISDRFKYTIKQKIRLITYSKEDLLAVSEKTLLEKVDSGYELDKNEISSEIIKDVADFEKGSLSLKIDVMGLAWPKIDQANFKKGIANKNEEEFGGILKNYQEIKKVDIKYTPGWLSGVSVSEQKIHIEEKRIIFEDN